MSKREKIEDKFFLLKIIQSGETIRIKLTNVNLRKNFKEFYVPILKRLRLKEKNIFITNEEGKMLENSDLELRLKEISVKFGNRFKLYSEKVF